ncbi:MAG: hypothetical protein JWQ35_29 [Bacteriovoracaceae bacterium]|nr:hypothetical protein [Bacteriovoracaceae bacterium]
MKACGSLLVSFFLLLALANDGYAGSLDMSSADLHALAAACRHAKTEASSIEIPGELIHTFDETSIFVDPSIIFERSGSEPLVDSSIKKLKIIGRKIESLSRKGHLIFYPLSGDDGWTALSLFPSAETIVAFDDHAFSLIPPLGEATLRISKTAAISKGISYTPLFLVGSRGRSEWHREILPVLLEKMLFSHPEIRIRRVSIFKHWPNAVSSELRHGLIEFDSGPGTKIRKYIHLQSQYTGTESPENWWLQFLDKYHPTAVIIKGSLDTFLSARNLCHAPEFTNQIVSWLKSSNGILVEGKSLAHYCGKKIWEFSGNNTFENSKSKIIKSVEYSYGKEVKITLFNPPPGKDD